MAGQVYGDDQRSEWERCMGMIREVYGDDQRGERGVWSHGDR